MCLVHSPSAPAPPPPPQYLHNPFLDGASMGQGSNRGRNSLVTLPIGNNASPTATTITPRIGLPWRPGSPGPTAPSAGTTLPPGTVPMMGQPGTVVPTVGGVMSGLMGGAITNPTGMARMPPGMKR